MERTHFARLDHENSQEFVKTKMGGIRRTSVTDYCTVLNSGTVHITAHYYDPNDATPIVGVASFVRNPSR